MDMISSLTTEVMNKTLDGLSKRNTAIASNLANVDTPNYARHDVSFEGALNNAIQAEQGGGQPTQGPASNDVPLAMITRNPGHLGGASFASISDFTPEMTESSDLEYRKDGNAVDVETEMVKLARNTQKYQAVSNLESRNFKAIRGVINAGS